MIFIATMMVLSAQAAPTVAVIERLSPEAAGDVALSGKEHNPVVEVAVRKVRGPEPLGWVELEMVEPAKPTAGGCVRRRWTVSFSTAPNGAANDARLSGAHAGTELALRRPAGCQTNSYVILNGGLDTVQGLAALAYLDKIRLSRVRAEFSCSDSTASNLCAVPRTMPRELAKISPWAVMHEGETTIFWLGVPGETVTEVRYADAYPKRIIVRRSIPPPF